MNIRPVQGPPAPSPIPTAAEVAADPTLAAPAPFPNRASRRTPAMLLGAGLLGALLRPAASSADDAPPPVVTQDTSTTDATPTETSSPDYTKAPAPASIPLVAPILPTALEEDGRGAFGCIALDPPATLSESDALDIIRQEFAQAGINLLPASDLGDLALLPADRPGAPAPPCEDSPSDETRELAKQHASAFGGEPPSWNSERKWIFDLATEDGSLLVEYLSRVDYDRVDLTKHPDWPYSYECYDFPKLAVELRERFESHPSDTPSTVALFFDPMVNTWEKGQNEWNSDEATLRRHQIDEYVLTRVKFHAQIAYFLEWARREGLLPSSVPQPPCP